MFGMDTIIFDFDGTLATCPYDFARMRQAALEVAAQYELPMEELEGKYTLEAIEHGAELLGADGEQAAEFRRRALRAVTEVELEAAPEAEMLHGVAEALNTLRGDGFKIGIVTRNCLPVVEMVLEGSGLNHDVLLTRERVSKVKPHPEHLTRALELLESDASRSLMVGDHPTDMVSGKTVGMKTVGVLTGHSSEQDLKAAGADSVLPSVVELVPLLTEKKQIP